MPLELPVRAYLYPVYDSFIYVCIVHVAAPVVRRKLDFVRYLDSEAVNLNSYDGKFVNLSSFVELPHAPINGLSKLPLKLSIEIADEIWCIVLSGGRDTDADLTHLRDWQGLELIERLSLLV